MCFIFPRILATRLAHQWRAEILSEAKRIKRRPELSVIAPNAEDAFVTETVRRPLADAAIGEKGDQTACSTLLRGRLRPSPQDMRLPREESLGAREATAPTLVTAWMALTAFSSSWQ